MIPHIIPVTNKEWRDKRSWSWDISIGSGSSLSYRGNQGLISSTNTTACHRERRWMMVPTMIMHIHSWESISGHLTGNRWTIPMIVEIRTISDTSTRIWGWWVNSNIGNIWAWMSSRWYSRVFSKYSMLTEKIMIYKVEMKTFSLLKHDKKI